MKQVTSLTPTLITRKRLEGERKSFSVEQPTNSKPKTKNSNSKLVN